MFRRPPHSEALATRAHKCLHGLALVQERAKLEMHNAHMCFYVALTHVYVTNAHASSLILARMHACITHECTYANFVACLHR